MGREVKNKAASIRARLMNIARAEKIDFDFLLLSITILPGKISLSSGNF